MKLSEYLDTVEDCDDVAVMDSRYYMKVYFDITLDMTDRWYRGIRKLTELIEVVEIKPDGVVVNLGEIITASLDKLNKSELFYMETDTEGVIASIDAIVSGGVGVGWLEKFVDCLYEGYGGMKNEAV